MLLGMLGVDGRVDGVKWVQNATQVVDDLTRILLASGWVIVVLVFYLFRFSFKTRDGVLVSESVGFIFVLRKEKRVGPGREKMRMAASARP